MLDLISEIALHTDFSDIDKLKERLLNIKTTIETQFSYMPHIYAKTRLASYYKLGGKINEVLGGIEFYDYLCDLLDGFETKAKALISNLNKVKDLIISKENSTLLFVGNNEDYQNLKEKLKTFWPKLDRERTNLAKAKWEFKLNSGKEAFKTSADIQYVFQGFNTTEFNHLPKGVNIFVESILRLDYFWNEIRVKGGAYGALTAFSNSGNFFAGSYRDPNLQNTLQVYAKTPEYLRSFNLEKAEFTRLLIGAFGQLDKPLSPEEKAEIALARYYSGISHERIQEIRSGLYNVKLEDVNSYANLIKEDFLKIIILLLVMQAKLLKMLLYSQALEI